MKGLILKDIFTLRKQGRILFVIIVFYTLFAVVSKSASMLAMIELLLAMMPITTMAYDEQCKWDKYALSMPVSRKTMVLSKYLFGIMLDLFGMVIVLLISLVMIQTGGDMKVNDTLLMVLGIGCVAITFLALVLPILFKFGVEKGRMLMMLVIFIPVLLTFLAPKIGIELPNEETLKRLVYLSPVAVIVIVFFSLLISIRIYEKKEF